MIMYLLVKGRESKIIMGHLRALLKKQGWKEIENSTIYATHLELG